jgi:hypothetical protein
MALQQIHQLVELLLRTGPVNEFLKKDLGSVRHMQCDGQLAKIYYSG